MDKLRQERLRLQREIGALYQEQNGYWCDYVRPNAAAAKLATGASKGAGLAATRVLPLEAADRLDRSTPTGAFEYGRAHMERLNGEIRKRRKQLARVEAEQAQAREEVIRRGRAAATDAGRPEDAGAGAGRRGDRQPPDLSLLPGAQWLDRFRGLVHDARAGGGAFSERSTT